MNLSEMYCCVSQSCVCVCACVTDMSVTEAGSVRRQPPDQRVTVVKCEDVTLSGHEQQHLPAFILASSIPPSSVAVVTSQSLLQEQNIFIQRQDVAAAAAGRNVTPAKCMSSASRCHASRLVVALPLAVMPVD